jgi:adenylate cyclase
MPLINRDGYALGTLCVIDFKAHEISSSQREAIRSLAQQAVAQLELRRQLLERDVLLGQLSEAKAAAEAARERSDVLLRNTMPASIAEELKAHDRVRPRYHEAATVLFADFKDFVRLTETLEPASLIEQLNQNFARFDQIVEGNRLETLKTIGDAYMCVGGLPEPNRTHAIDACLAALQMQKFLRNANRQRERLHLAPWELRIGISTGSLVAGVVGTRRLTYDVWGNTANLAQRLQAACEPGRINVAGSTFHQAATLFETEPRGRVEVKHMDAIDMYFLNRIRPDLAADAEGCLPNDRFWNAKGLG